MRQFWLVLGLVLALPEISPVFWPFLLGLVYLTRPVLGQFALLGFLLLRLPTVLPVWQGWMEGCRDRMASAISVYPDRIFADHEQTAFLYAPHSHRLLVHWQGNQLPLPVQSLGHGLFRLKLAGPTVRPGSFLDVESDGDGHSQLPLHWLPAKIRPGQMSSWPEAGLAAAVSQSTDEVLLIHREGKVRRVPCGDGPSCCQFLPGARLLAVGNRYSADLELLDLESSQVCARWPLPEGAQALSLSQDSRYLGVLAGRTVQVRRLPDLTLEADIKLPEEGEFLVFAGAHLVVSSREGRCLYRIDQSRGWKLLDRVRPLARPALGLCSGKDTDEVWLGSTSAQLNGGHQKGNHFVLNCLLRLDVPGWKLHSPVSTELRTAQQGGPGSVSSGCGPEGLIRSGDGRILLVYSGSHEVAARDPKTGEEQRYSLASGEVWTPRSVADLGQDTWVVSSPALHTLAWVKQGEIVQKLQLDSIDVADFGEVDFYEATLTGISCQSCHTGGDSDYARHDIGGYSAWGTLSCQGIAGSAPYLRNGSYARMQDLHSVSLGLYRGYGRVWDNDRPGALQAYLETLLLPDSPRVSELSELKRGCDIFFQSGCADCHQPPQFTNCAAVPNQNLFPGQAEFEWLDVPSLHGVWRSGPYLHDHRAPRLSDLWSEQNPADRHGSTRSLTRNQRRDLESFLQCL